MPEGAPPHASTLGPYRLLATRGRGAMGTVYLAETEGARVALKVLHPHLAEREGFFERFQREAEAGRAVEHAHVVRTLDSDLLVLEDGVHCLVHHGTRERRS